MPRAGDYKWWLGIPKDINRLITSLYPSGRVIFQDDFEAILVKWKSVVVGTGTVRRDTAKALMGEASLQINTSNGADDSTEALRFIGQSIYKRGPLGLEVWINPKAMATGQEVWIGFEWYAGAVYYSAYLKYLKGTGWQVSTPLGWQTISAEPLLIQDDDYLWQYIKLIADLLTKKYIKAIIDGSEFDLSGYKTLQTAGAQTPRLEFFLWARNNGVASIQIHRFDNCLVTCDEP